MSRPEDPHAYDRCPADGEPISTRDVNVGDGMTDPKTGQRWHLHCWDLHRAEQRERPS